MSFLNEFPSNNTPRQLQKEIICEIETAIKEKGYRKIIICAPTGSGKSHIAVTIAKALKSSIIITAQKILQDQYVKDFPWIYPMKGKGNFPCLALYDSNLITYQNAMKDRSLLCDKGNCSWVVFENNKKETRYCEFHSELDQFKKTNQGTEKEKVNGPKNICYYYEQKFKALHASHSIYNYSSFFQTKKFNLGYEDLLDKQCLIVDEAHEIEEQIINFIGFEISKFHLEEVNFQFSNYELNNNEQILIFLEQLGEAYQKQINENDIADVKLVDLKNTLEKINMIVFQMQENAENVVVDISKNKDNTVTKISLKPIEISEYIEDFFDYPYQIYLSATINKKIFCKMMGFFEDECYFIEIKKSPFLLENRKIIFENIASLSSQTSSNDWSKIYSKINEIACKHSEKRGLILTSSKQQCLEIFTNIHEDSAERISILHNDVNQTKEEILALHGEEENSILLSPSLWYGIDLHDDLSRFQIIVKTPFPYLGEKRTKLKKDKDPLWYQYTTLVKLLQGFGRSIRNEHDSATTFVLDKNAETLLENMKEYVPQAYYDVLGWKE